MAAATHEHRVVLLGLTGVGKSALTIQLINRHFVDEYDPTIEDFYRMQLVIDRQACLLEICDTVCLEDTSHEQHFAMGDGFMLIYSITSRRTYDQIFKYREGIHHAKSEAIPMVIVGNKCDLESEREVGRVEAENLARSYSISFFEITAREFNGIFEALSELVRLIRKAAGIEPTKPQQRTRASCSML